MLKKRFLTVQKTMECYVVLHNVNLPPDYEAIFAQPISPGNAFSLGQDYSRSGPNQWNTHPLIFCSLLNEKEWLIGAKTQTGLKEISNDSNNHCP